MKKFLAVTICAVLLSALLIVPAAARTPFEITTPQAPSAITVNGVRDAAYGDSYTPIAVPFAAEDGATGRLWTAWTADRVYFYIEVLDTTPNHNGGNPLNATNDNNWRNDGITFWIDWNAARGTDRENNGQPYTIVRINSAPNVDGVQISAHVNNTGFPGTGALPEIAEFVVAPLVGNDLSGGYIMEVAFNRPEGVTLGLGKAISFDLCINDDQHGAGRSSRMFISENPDPTHASGTFNDRQGGNPSNCNSILLLSAAAAPAAPTPPAAPQAPTPAPGAQAPAAQQQAPAAPQTFDPIVLIAVAALISAGGIMIARKRTASRP